MSQYIRRRPDMKKWIKKWMIPVLLFVMMISVVAPSEVCAGTKSKSYTLYKGEKTSISVSSGTIKSVTSSDKSVVTAKKEKGSTKRIDFTAKKTGSATVTVKTTKSTYKYRITVKKLDITGTMTDICEGGLLLTIHNNTSQTFAEMELTYTLREKNGATLTTGTKTVRNVVSKATIYDIAYYYATYKDKIDASKCTFSATSVDRSPGVTYKNTTSKLSLKTSLSNNGTWALQINIKVKNKLKSTSVTATVYLLTYDPSGKVVDLTEETFYLKPGGSSQTEKTIELEYGEPLEHYTYEAVSVAFSYTF
jgi:hypothetical protein